MTSTGDANELEDSHFGSSPMRLLNITHDEPASSTGLSNLVDSSNTKSPVSTNSQAAQILRINALKAPSNQPTNRQALNRIDAIPSDYSQSNIEQSRNDQKLSLGHPINHNLNFIKRTNTNSKSAWHESLTIKPMSEDSALVSKRELKWTTDVPQEQADYEDKISDWYSMFPMSTPKPIKLSNRGKNNDSSSTYSNADKHNQKKLFCNSLESTAIKKRLASQEYNDYISDNDQSLIAFKPTPSSSISKNFISMLNHLSLPVTRKLKFWNKKSFQVNDYDPNFKVIYLGNLGIQLWSKDEQCLEKPLATLWNNYLVHMKSEILMRLTICNSGLKAITRQHGLTQYWSNRLVYCCTHKNHPRVFAWIYRHEAKKMRQELRCHAVLCPSPDKANRMVTALSERLSCALQEFRREKKLHINPRVDFATNSPTLQHEISTPMPLRRQILAKGAANFRPPIERSKSAPKLTSIIEEDFYEDHKEYESSQDEYEYQESFEDKEDDDDEDEDYDAYDCDDRAYYIVDDLDTCNAHNLDNGSLTTMTNEETSGSSVVAYTEDLYDGSDTIRQDSPYVTSIQSQEVNDERSQKTMTHFYDNLHRGHNHQNSIVTKPISDRNPTGVPSEDLNTKRGLLVTNGVDNNNLSSDDQANGPNELCEALDIVLSWPKSVQR